MGTTITRSESYACGIDGIFEPEGSVSHRDEEYDSNNFEALLKMQSDHFWYRGRHRFLFGAFESILQNYERDGRIEAVDLGGGCGGWVKYLQDRAFQSFSDLALADSSRDALKAARDVVWDNVGRYQVDLLNLQWCKRWDVAFLLDVLEHIPQDVEALRQIYCALRPGGYLFVTTPALKQFWSYNDDLAHHVQRYSRKDFQDLANECGFELQLSRYFMFFLSPLLYATRMRKPKLDELDTEAIRSHLEQTHRVPSAPVNQILRFIFSMETPLGLKVPFPWGTSILGVFRKPIDS